METCQWELILNKEILQEDHISYAPTKAEKNIKPTTECKYKSLENFLLKDGIATTKNYSRKSGRSNE